MSEGIEQKAVEDTRQSVLRKYHGGPNSPMHKAMYATYMKAAAPGSPANIQSPTSSSSTRSKKQSKPAPFAAWQKKNAADMTPAEYRDTMRPHIGLWAKKERNKIRGTIRERWLFIKSEEAQQRNNNDNDVLSQFTEEGHKKAQA